MPSTARRMRCLCSIFSTYGFFHGEADEAFAELLRRFTATPHQSLRDSFPSRGSKMGLFRSLRVGQTHRVLPDFSQANFTRQFHFSTIKKSMKRYSTLHPIHAINHTHKCNIKPINPIQFTQTFFAFYYRKPQNNPYSRLYTPPLSPFIKEKSEQVISCSLNTILFCYVWKPDHSALGLLGSSILSMYLGISTSEPSTSI